MKFVHGDLSMDIPDNWEDRSQIAFAEPADRSIADEMAKRAAASGAPMHLAMPGSSKPSTNFVISQRPYTLDVEPREFLETELKAMVTTLPSLNAAGDLDWTEMAGAEAATLAVEIQFDDSPPLKQLHALAVVHSRVVHFIGTCTPGGFEKARPVFMYMMKSVSIDPPGDDSDAP